MDIVIATNNENKIKEIFQILRESKLDYNIKTLKDMNIDYDVEETGLTFEFNAIKKAKEYYQLCNTPVIAEDSGIIIESLDNMPGVFTKRIFEHKTEEEANEIILENLEGHNNRNASYIAVYCYYDGVNTIVAKGETKGYIDSVSSGDNGFAYDRIFYSTELNKKFSEMTDEEKNSISHRKKGLKELFKKIGNIK